MSNPLNGILGSSGGGSGGSGDVVGPASSTDNAIARFDGATGKLLQNSDVTVSDLAAGAVTITAGKGTAITLKNTDPDATTGASVAGDALTITAGNAVASTDTAGAAAGGSVTITAGAAARLTSGDADGGDITLATGAAVGNGNAGQVIIPNGADSRGVGLRFASAADDNTGWRHGSVGGTNGWIYQAAGGPRVGIADKLHLVSTTAFGWSPSTNMTTAADTSINRIAAGQMAVNNATNGMANNIKIATTTVNASGATSTASNLVPAGCILLGVTTRVTTAITSGDGGTSVNIGNGTDADMYGATIAFALGTTTNLASHTASALAWKSAAESVVFTCVGGTFNGGVWRVCAHYLDLTAPTS